jgi:hypothetical protein
MDTSRVVINITDNSTTYVQETTEITGFTVVKAPKGPCTPVKIYKNGASDLKDIFGVSSKDYPNLFEAETFNREYDLYVSAPYAKGTKIPVAYLTPNGIVKGGSLIDYNEAIEKYVLGEEDNIKGADTIFLSNVGSASQEFLRDTRYPERYGLPGKSEFDYRIPGYQDITAITGGSELGGLLIYTGIKKSNASSIPNKLRIENGDVVADYTVDKEGYSIKKNNNTQIGVFLAQNPTGGWKTSSQFGANDDLWIYIYGDANILRNVSVPEVRKSIKSYWVDTLNKNDVYAVIFPKFPSDRKLSISFSSFDPITGYDGSEAKNWNILKMRVFEEGAFHDSTNSIYMEGSLDTKARASDGSFIGFSAMNASYNSQNLVGVYVFRKFEDTDNVDSTIKGFGSIELEGGVRVTTGDIYTDGWNKAKDSEYSDVDIFFESESHEGADSTANEVFLGLATDDYTSHNLAGYVFNKTLSPDTLGEKGEKVDVSSKLGDGYNYWNICNLGIIEDRTKGTRFLSSLTGAYARMIARILQYKFGGAAPMWENTSVSGVGLGGQLDMINVYKLKYKYNKRQLDILDDLNYNPVINDRQYGIMVTGQKTCKSGSMTDWSYIGHVAAFLNFLKQVRANVMIPQIGKPNNPYYRALRKDQVDAYLAQRLNGSDRIWAWAECDTSTADGVNDVYALKARKFVIKVRVQVDVFSEKVELNFTNEGQDSIVNVAQ